MNEAREQQAATAEILKVIASSRDDAQPVFDAIAASANRLVGGFSTAVYRVIDDIVYLVAFTPTNPQADDVLKAAFPMHRSKVPAVAVAQNGETAQIADAETADAQTQNLGRARGWRSVTFTPLMNQDAFIGFIACTRREKGLLSEHHVQLLRTFADQAVIAIENARLFDEVQTRTRDLQESLQQQTATADVLKVISRSAFDLQTVLETLTESATQLCNADMGSIARKDEAGYYHATAYKFAVDWVRVTDPLRLQPGRDSLVGRVLLEEKAVQIADVLADPEYSYRDMQKAAGYRSLLGVPLLRQGEPIGVLFLGRRTVEPFTDKQVELVSTFADQAVIAIENVRLFEEVQAKTRDLEEALRYQTGSANILNVIASSPTDVQPVLKAIVESACELCEAYDAVLRLRIGNDLVFGAHHGPIPVLRSIWPLSPNWTGGRAVIEQRPVYIDDYFSDEGAEFPEGQAQAREEGHRSILSVPLLREGEGIGVLTLRRKEANPFQNKQIALLQTFTDQAVIALGNVGLFQEVQARTRELQESLQQQTATADVLKVISRSAFDLQPVLDSLVETAASLCETKFAFIIKRDGDVCRLVASCGAAAGYTQWLRENPTAVTRGSPGARAIIDKKIVHIHDVLADPDYHATEHQSRGGYRTVLGVPLLRDDEAIGAFSLAHTVVKPFTEKQIELVTTFADQAVIAIENVRLFNETKEALERQTATAEILKVIASSPSRVQPVFDAIAQQANRLIGGHVTAIVLFNGDIAELGGFTPLNEIADSKLRATFPRPIKDFALLELVRSGETAQIFDFETDRRMPEQSKEMARAAGFRSQLLTPLIGDLGPIGLIGVTRREPGGFDSHHIQLMRTFADQAVIAIQNAHLFEEVQAKTRDLSESLQQQTATADVLKVISRTAFDLNSVLNTLVESAVTLSGADAGTIYQKRGELYHLTAQHGHAPEVLQYGRLNPLAPSKESNVGRTAMTGAVVEIPDVLADPDYASHGYQRVARYRAMLGIPLKRDGKVEGVFSLVNRSPGPFEQRHIDLVQTFADQAVIAIENARLFNEVQERTDDLSESLQQQTATADLLQVISRSAFDLQPVFDAIAERAVTLCGADRAFIFRFDGELLRMAAAYNAPPDFKEWVAEHPIRPGRHSGSARAALERRTIHIHDVRADPEYTYGAKDAEDIRTVLGVPILKGDELLGVMMIYHLEGVRPFTEKQIALVETFADQAAIAIENVRLFHEAEQRTEDLAESLQQQTAVGDVLKTISRSTFDLQPVLDTLVETAARLCDTENAYILHRDGDVYRSGAAVGFVPDFIEFLKNHPIKPDGGTLTGRVVLERRPVQILDVATEPGYTMRESVTLANQHTLLGVPLLRENEPIGVIVLARQRVEAFTQKHVDLVTTFADQAVIAIENVRLFDQLQHRTDDLAESLQQQTATSEVLQIISSSPGELGPVFDKMLENATRVCGAKFGSMMLIDKDSARQVALYNAPAALAAARTDKIFHPQPKGPMATVIQTKQAVQVADMRTTSGYLEGHQTTLELVDLGGARTVAVVPMLREDDVIGTITIYRQEVRPFSDKQIDLVSNFARQAVIAIENARLLRELRQRTDDLSEALVYQTGSSNILKVIASSPTDVGPALKAIVESACEICDAYDAGVLLRDGDDLHFSAHHGPIKTGQEPRPINRGWVVGRSVIDKVPVQVSDFDAPEAVEFPEGRRQSREQGHRCTLSVPLLREGEAIGAIALRRVEPVAFSDKQVALLTTFADQAVIAIGNVRLFDEVQARTRDLQESLEQQTATAEILASISASMNDTKPVFDAIAKSLRRLFDASSAMVQTLNDGIVEIVAADGEAGFERLRKQYPRALSRDRLGGIAMVEKRTVQVHPVLGNPAAPPATQENARELGFNSLLFNPMLSGDKVVGAIGVARREAIPFDDKQIALIASFANQAVIAIENTRLLRELRERTDALTQSLNDLRAAQDRLVQTEKLASLGQLTAGIAHEIKNPLNFVNNFSALSVELTDELNDVLKQATLAEKIQEEVGELTRMLKSNLEKVVQHGKRADSIVKNMLLHSREGRGERRTVDINSLVEESLNLAYHGARAERSDFQIALEHDLDPGAGQIELYPQEITRALLNMISNGFYAATRRASEAGNGYEPTLRAVTRGFADRVEIRIRDNGTGIPPEVKDKMFNPFFTTKPAGEGTGLGLSMSHDIVVKQHGGTIDVETEPGAFTEIIVTLPRATSSPKRSTN